MELGALVCTPRSPGCAGCPLRAPCRARRQEDPTAYPRKAPRRKVPHHQVAIGVVQDDRGKVLIQRRPYEAMLGGLWEFPGGKLEPGEAAEQALARELREELGLEAEPVRALPTVDHAYTHFKVTLHPFLCRLGTMNPRAGEGQPHRWVAPADLSEHPMPRANRKVLEALMPLVSGGQRDHKG